MHIVDLSSIYYNDPIENIILMGQAEFGKSIRYIQSIFLSKFSLLLFSDAGQGSLSKV
jgi:hypothetical protein